MVLPYTSAEIAIGLILLGGTKVEGTVLHYGPVPPPGGPARTEALRIAGLGELNAARINYVMARAESRCDVSHYLQPPHAPWWIYSEFPARIPSCAVSGRNKLGEDRAREALRRSVTAFNLLEDLDQAQDAHRLAHEIGAFASWHYGCKIVKSDDSWHWTCPVMLMHLRMGWSAGFSGDRFCSICDQDITECEHRRGRLYRVPVMNTDTALVAL